MIDPAPDPVCIGFDIGSHRPTAALLRIADNDINVGARNRYRWRLRWLAFARPDRHAALDRAARSHDRRDRRRFPPWSTNSSVPRPGARRAIRCRSPPHRNARRFGPRGYLRIAMPSEPPRPKSSRRAPHGPRPCPNRPVAGCPTGAALSSNFLCPTAARARRAAPPTSQTAKAIPTGASIDRPDWIVQAKAPHGKRPKPDRAKAVASRDRPWPVSRARARQSAESPRAEP